MTLDEILAGLFPDGYTVTIQENKLILGQGQLGNNTPIHVVGIADGEPLGINGAVTLAGRVLEIVSGRDKQPILVMIDTQGQLMARRDEMLGLNEYLAHLAKSLLLASREGHKTIGLNYGKAAAGAFLATALATDRLVGLPGAEPAVMDLPSMARVTKLPEEKLRAMSATAPVFAPGLDSMVTVGAVAEIWDPRKPLSDQLKASIAAVSGLDERDELGASRGGRKLAAQIARRVAEQVSGASHV